MIMFATTLVQGQTEDTASGAGKAVVEPSDAQVRDILQTVLRERVPSVVLEADVLKAAESPNMGARIDAIQQRLKRVARGIPDIRVIPAQARAWVGESGGAAALVRALLSAR